MELGACEVILLFFTQKKGNNLFHMTITRLSFVAEHWFLRDEGLAINQ